MSVETMEERHDRRRKRDRLLEYIRVYWPMVVAMVFVVSAWAQNQLKVVEIDRRVEKVEISQKTNTDNLGAIITKVAVVEANIGAIKEQVDDVKTDTQRILYRLGEMSAAADRHEPRRPR